MPLRAGGDPGESNGDDRRTYRTGGEGDGRGSGLSMLQLDYLIGGASTSSSWA